MLAIWYEGRIYVVGLSQLASRLSIRWLQLLWIRRAVHSNSIYSVLPNYTISTKCPAWFPLVPYFDYWAVFTFLSSTEVNCSRGYSFRYCARYAVTTNTGSIIN